MLYESIRRGDGREIDIHSDRVSLREGDHVLWTRDFDDIEDWSFRHGSISILSKGQKYELDLVSGSDGYRRDLDRVAKDELGKYLAAKKPLMRLGPLETLSNEDISLGEPSYDSTTWKFISENFRCSVYCNVAGSIPDAFLFANRLFVQFDDLIAVGDETFRNHEIVKMDSPVFECVPLDDKRLAVIHTLGVTTIEGREIVDNRTAPGAIADWRMNSGVLEVLDDGGRVMTLYPPSHSFAR